MGAAAHTAAASAVQHSALCTCKACTAAMVQRVQATIRGHLYRRAAQGDQHAVLTLLAHGW